MSEEKRIEVEIKVNRIHELQGKLQASDYELAKSTETMFMSEEMQNILKSLKALIDKGEVATLQELIKVLYDLFSAIKIDGSIIEILQKRISTRTELQNLIEDVTTNYINPDGEPYYTKEVLVGKINWE